MLPEVLNAPATHRASTLMMHLKSDVRLRRLDQVRRGVMGQGLGLPLPETLPEPNNPTAESMNRTTLCAALPPVSAHVGYISHTRAAEQPPVGTSSHPNRP